MPGKKFEATLRQRADTSIIDLHGEVNATADEKLTAIYAESELHRTPVVLLNFGDVDYINSTGIALIVGLLAQALKTKRRLMVCGLSDHYTEMFNITRLSDFMNIFADESSALAESIQPASKPQE
jgi:anti-sigma B factor antagonist